MGVFKYRKSIGGYILDSIFGVGQNNNQKIEDDEEDNYCEHCGSKILKKEKDFICKGSWCEATLCSECAKKCRKCKKYFCLEHVNNHKCDENKNDDKSDEDGAFICDKCEESFELTKKEWKELNRYGEIRIKCPNCNKTIICEYT